MKAFHHMNDLKAGWDILQDGPQVKYIHLIIPMKIYLIFFLKQVSLMSHMLSRDFLVS